MKIHNDLQFCLCRLSYQLDTSRFMLPGSVQSVRPARRTGHTSAVPQRGTLPFRLRPARSPRCRPPACSVPTQLPVRPRAGVPPLHFPGHTPGRSPGSARPAPKASAWRQGWPAAPPARGCARLSENKAPPHSGPWLRSWASCSLPRRSRRCAVQHTPCCTPPVPALHQGR